MANEKRKIELEASVTADPSGFQQISDAARDTARVVEQSGQQASRGTEAIGASAEKSAAQMERAYGRMEAEARRTAAILKAQAEGTGKAGELINRALSQGLDPARLQTQLSQIAKYEAAVRGVGTSAKETAWAMRSVPAQFTDIVTSLQAGQQPMTVLMQQGGQLKDMFGGAGNAARAMASYVARLITPLNMAAAASAALAVAYYKGSEEAKSFAKALILSGNAAGTSVEQLQAMQTRVAAVTGTTKGAVADALNQIASTGKVSADAMGFVADAAIRMERVTGTAVEDTVKQFAELGKSPVDASKKLNDQYNYLTAAVYQQIKALEDQGRVIEAANLAQKSYADALAERTEKIRQNLGLLETGWKAVGDGAKAAWDKMLNIGREQSLEQKIAAQVKYLQDLRNSRFYVDTTAAENELTRLQIQLEKTKQMSAAEAERNRIQKDGIAAVDAVAKANEKAMTKQEQMNKALADYRDNIAKIRAADPNSALLDPAKIAAAEKGIREQYKERAAAVKKVTDQYGPLINSINERVAAEQAALVSSEQLTSGEKFALKVQTDLRDGTLKLNDVQKRSVALAIEQLLIAEKQNLANKERIKFDEQRAKYVSSYEEETRALVEKAKAAEYENSLIGKSVDEIAQLTQARYDERIAILEEKAAAMEAIAGRTQELDAIEAQIAALKRLQSAEVAKPKLQAQAREWENFTRDIERSLTDALYRAFESGDSFGEAFAKNLENTFKSMVLKFAIQSAVTTGGNLLNSGINAVMGTSGTNYLGLANNASSIYNLYGAATGYSPQVNAVAALFGAGSTVGASSASLAYANAVGALGGDSLGALIAANGSWAGVSTGAAAAGSAGAASAAGATAAEGAAAAGSASAAGAAGSTAWIPYVGWAIAAAAAIYAFSDKIFGGDWEPSGAPRFTGAFSEANQGMVSAYTLQDYNKDGGWFGSDDSETRATAITNEFDAMLDRMYTSMRDSYLEVGRLFDDTNLKDKLVGFGLRINETDFSNAQAAVDQMAKQLGETMGRVLFPSIAALQTTGEAWSATFQRVVQEAEAVNAVFNRLGTTLAKEFGKNNADRVLKLADGLVQAFGGIDAMGAAAQKYYAGYYSQGEQQDAVRAAFAQQFAGLGLTMPETRAQFRRLVESLDLTSASGQKTYATLLNMAEGFGAWADSLASTVDTMSSEIEAALSGLFDDLLQQVQGARDGVASARDTVNGIDVMTAAQIRAAIATASPTSPNGNNILTTQAALQKTIADSNTAIDAAIKARDAEQAAVNERNRGWSYLVADLPNIFGGSYNGGEQINEMWAIYNALSAEGLGTGFSGSSNYRDSSAYFNPLPAGYQYFLDGSPIGSSLQLNHGQDWVSANGITWGRYNRNLDVYAYKPYGSEVINPWYDQNVANAKTAGAAAITAAEQAAVQAQIDYTRAIQQYVLDAGKAVEKLNYLREETVKYYQAQQQLADTLITSAYNLREAVRLARQSQMDEAELLASRQREFAQAYSMALSTTGTVQASYADKMAAALPSLVPMLEAQAKSQVDWERATGQLYAQSNTIAGMLEATAAVDYQSESLALLGAIDTTLAVIEANASSAEKIISDAVYKTGATTADGLRAVIAAIKGDPIPAFATGGVFGGGWRIVGENGPELEATGPSRIFNFDQTQALFSGPLAMNEMVAELRALRAENADLRAEVRAVATHTYRSARKLEEVVGDGIIVRTETGAPLETTTV